MTGGRGGTGGWARVLGLSAAAVVLSAGGTAAQSTDSPRPEPMHRAAVLERVTRDRWIHEGQSPGVVAFTEREEAIHLALSGRGRLRFRERGTEVDFSLDERGAVRFTSTDARAVHFSRWDDAAERARTRRRGLTGQGALQALPSARFWEIPLSNPGRSLVVGTEWTDTVAFVADPGESLVQRLEGVRHHRVVGDTVLGDRHLPVMEVRAEVRFLGTSFEDDYALGGLFRIERDVAGTIHGRVVADTALGIIAGGADTTAWAGTAVLHTPEGSRYPSGVRYERTRSWILRDSTEWQAERDSLRARRRTTPAGMLHFPDSLEIRFRRGDPGVADSLLGAWEATDDPDLREAIERQVELWSRGQPRHDTLLARLDRLHEDAGDSARAVFRLLGVEAPRLTAARARLLLPYLEDPGRLWKLGHVPVRTYSSLGTRMLYATPLLRESWGCDPEACAWLLDAAEGSREPRLRDVALVGAFGRDPATYFDAVSARADSGSVLAQKALLLGRGVGATWPAAPKVAIPEEGASWREWLTWMGGSVRFQESHRDAITFFKARTGRDPVAEILSRWPPQADSARLVWSTILRGMDALPETDLESLRGEFLSGSEARVSAALGILRPLLREAPPAPPDVAGEVVGVVMDSVLARGTSPWPGVEGFQRTAGRVLPGWALSPAESTTTPVFLLDENLPPGVPRPPRPNVQVVDSATWAQYDLREGGVLIALYPTRALGPFLWVNWRWSEYFPREDDAPPGGYAGGGGLILMRGDGGWWVVGADGWIT